MNCQHRPSKLLITGTSGSGKTTLYIEQIKLSKARWKFLFDHEGELAHRLPCTAATTAEELGQQVATGVAVFDPCMMFPGRLPTAFDFFCDYTFACAQRLRGPKLIACDELQKLIGTMQCPLPLATILDTGRRYELDCVFVSQSPNLIHTRVRNQLTHVATFRQVDERAVQFLEDCGFDEQQVRALPPGTCIIRDLNTGQITSRVIFRASKKSNSLTVTKKVDGQTPA